MSASLTAAPTRGKVYVTKGASQWIGPPAPTPTPLCSSSRPSPTRAAPGGSVRW